MATWRTHIPMSNDQPPTFLESLIALCKRHNARLFARSDGKSPIIGVMVGETWTDFKRINGEEAVPYDGH